MEHREVELDKKRKPEERGSVSFGFLFVSELQYSTKEKAMLDCFFKCLALLGVWSLIVGGIVSCNEKPRVGDNIEAKTSKEVAGNLNENNEVDKATEKTVLSLSFEKVLDMGNVYEFQRKRGAFYVTNTSDTSQTITFIEPTCECIKLNHPYEDIELQPGEKVEVVFEMNAITVLKSSYQRFININVKGGGVIKAHVGGWIVRIANLDPGRVGQLGFLKNPAQHWEQTFKIRGNPDLPETLTLGEVPENPYTNNVLIDEGNGNYTLTVTSKAPLPYTREFAQVIDIPVLKPVDAQHLPIFIKAQVAENVVFSPDAWNIVREKLEEAGQFTERFAYGEVPGLQEEKNDGVKDLKNMMKRSLLRQHNAVPLKFVKENHDWDDLFANLQYEVPAGVSVEKIRHPQGIELRITVTKEAFANDVKSVAVVPYRDINRCAPINIQIVE